MSSNELKRRLDGPRLITGYAARCKSPNVPLTVTCFCFFPLSDLSGSDQSASTQWFRRRQAHHHQLGSNYHLQDRICIGSMTAAESAAYEEQPTDEAEAKMLASADLDDMRSE